MSTRIQSSTSGENGDSLDRYQLMETVQLIRYYNRRKEQACTKPDPGLSPRHGFPSFSQTSRRTTHDICEKSIFSILIDIKMTGCRILNLGIAVNQKHTYKFFVI